MSKKALKLLVGVAKVIKFVCPVRAGLAANIANPSAIIVFIPNPAHRSRRWPNLLSGTIGFQTGPMLSRRKN
jgi:hypothetical protein